MKQRRCDQLCSYFCALSHKEKTRKIEEKMMKRLNFKHDKECENEVNYYFVFAKNPFNIT